MGPGVCVLLCTAHRISGFSYWTVIQQTISNLLTYLFTYLLAYLLTYLLTYLLIYSVEQRRSWESNRFSASQEIPRSVCNPKVHYRICSARHLSLSWARSVQPMPFHPTSWRSILILSYHLRLALPSVIPSGFSTKTLCTPLLSPVRATCPAHLILLDLITRTIFVDPLQRLR